MEILSREYGWTPEQIRQQRRQDIQDYLDIINIRRTLEKKELDRSKKRR
jgi:hypothetical protein